MTIIITIDSGAVQEVTGLTPGQVLLIHDYDLSDEQREHPDARFDENECCYQELRFEGAPAEDSEPGKRLRVCTECGSTDIVRDAWAEWDESAQEWVLQQFFDQVFCRDCDEITDVEPDGCDEVHGND